MALFTVILSSGPLRAADPRAAKEKEPKPAAAASGGRAPASKSAAGVARQADAAKKKGPPASRAADRGKPLAQSRPPEKRAPADSIGHPNDGRLQNGIRLDTSLPYLRVVPAYASGDVRWGLPVLVRMIERAARGVAKRHPGSVLPVGDLSKKNGGELGRHDSHESGRDADLGFYAVDARGKQILGRTFIRFDATLRSPDHPEARFDVARNWSLVELLLTDPRARVSHVFVAEPLRQALLAHARKRGVSRALLDRAAIAMLQPTDSLPHDDHFHVRISCPPSMRATCVELSKDAPIGRLAKPGKKGVGAAVRAPGRARGSASAARPSPARASQAREAQRAGSSRPSPRGPASAQPKEASRDGTSSPASPEPAAAPKPPPILSIRPAESPRERDDDDDDLLERVPLLRITD